MKKYKISARYLKTLSALGQNNTETWDMNTTVVKLKLFKAFLCLE